MVRHGVLTEGYLSPFRGRPWEEIRDGYVELSWPGLQPLMDVVDSVLACGGAERLVATTSMHDLWVGRSNDDGSASNVDLVKVRAFTSMRPVPPGKVVIEHTSVTGQDESITRPAAEAVPLFWRFVREKWGIEPWRWDDFDEAQRDVLMWASEEADLYEATWPRTIADTDGGRAVTPRDLAQAQQAVAELLRLSLVQVIINDGGRERVASAEDLVWVFGSGFVWRQPGGIPRVGLTLTPAGANWYDQKGSST